MRKHYDIGRIVQNAVLLSDPQIYENFLYETDDPEGFEQIEGEIEELSEMLPEGIGVLDLPEMICGNMKTKVYGKATCSSTNGHLILNNKTMNRVIFHSEAEAIAAGYRPCAICFPEAYDKWKKNGQNK